MRTVHTLILLQILLALSLAFVFAAPSMPAAEDISEFERELQYHLGGLNPKQPDTEDITKINQQAITQGEGTV